MQQNLWGEETYLLRRKPRRTPNVSDKLTPTDCLIYGHTWQQAGMSGEKKCSICHIKGYCPGCTPHPPEGAKPFFCTKHTPDTESR